jgi:hypothetical protein
MEGYECHVCLVLEKFQEVGLYTKWRVCEFHRSKVEFLDYIIYGDGIQKDFCKVQTIVHWVILTFVQNV